VSDYLTAQGEIYLKSQNANFKKRFGMVMGNELYCQKYENSQKHDFMHCLSGTFIDIPERIQNKTTSGPAFYYPLKIQIGQVKTRVLYLDSANKQKLWYNVLKKASGFSNIKDYYNIQEVIGKGQFGKVKKATNIRTGHEVAVKQIKKKKISPSELEMLRNEIEVLKICKHPSVVRLYDVFEDRSSIYIIMELIRGQDLYVYLKSREFKIPEPRIKQIQIALCEGVKFLQTFGVMHRDLKL
jgi:serine/threonine protein kinase